jgi:beta-galactosidase
MTISENNTSRQTLRERLSLDLGWRFHLGDIPMPEMKGHAYSYMNAKAGTAWGASAPDFDEGEWRSLDLPHDWVVEGPFLEEENISQGYRPRGIAWYRRKFLLEEDDQGKHLELQFDGIATHATVWVNGLLVHRSFCGYTPFQIDLTPIATYGDQPNTIAIRVDADAMEGWWYEGGGIYRHTWLVKRPPVHIQTDGVYAVPVRSPNGTWSLPVEVTLGNITSTQTPVEITAELLDPEGRRIVSERFAGTVPVLESVATNITLPVPGTPRLWSVDTPVLHTVRVSVSREGKLLDEASVVCGFRTIRFDADKGFFLNDQPLRLQGTCNHQDHAGVGVAVPDALWDFRINRLKDMGCNAYRSAHNQPAPEFLDACDRLGMLVMDENRNFNHTPEYLGQLRTMVRRDRNHPSVFLWSVFNEEPMQGTPQGREMVRLMVSEVRRLDPTRPITAAMNGGMNNAEGVFEAVDVMGFNYCDHAYDSFHAKHPDIPVFSSEDTSAFMTRGEYANDPERNVVSSYDSEFANWGHSHRKAWQLIAERPFLAGGFVWTGFDYRGEPQRLAWPSISSVFGIMDTCGFAKTAFHIHQAEWIKDRPVLAIAPHWNWAGREEEMIPVLAMTNAEEVALFLNGEPLGRKPKPPFDFIEWAVPYAPGRLEAVAYTQGNEVARTQVETTGAPAALRLVPERDWLDGNGLDAQPVTLSVVDAMGRIVPDAENLVTFTMDGPAENIGHGNGDHNCHDPEKGAMRRVFHGLAQLIVRSKTASGQATIRAEAEGLAPAELPLTVRPAEVPPFVAPVESRYQISNWIFSPPQNERPDPMVEILEADMNTWMSITPGTLQEMPAGRWAVYRARFRPWSSIASQGGEISFGALHGSAEVWLDGIKVLEKTDPSPAPLQIALPPSSSERVLTILIRPDESGSVGIPLPVIIDIPA